MSYKASAKAPIAGHTGSHGLRDRTVVVPAAVDRNEQQNAHQKLERKRATDRAAQREHRKRQKTYIAELEGQLEMLKSANSKDSVAQLAEENIRLRQEVAHLKTFVSGVRGLMVQVDKMSENDEQSLTYIRTESPLDRNVAAQTNSSEAAESPRHMDASSRNEVLRSADIHASNVVDREKSLWNELNHTPSSIGSSHHHRQLTSPSSRNDNDGQEDVSSTPHLDSNITNERFLNPQPSQISNENLFLQSGAAGEDASSSLSSFYRAFSESYASIDPSSYNFFGQQSGDHPRTYENSNAFQNQTSQSDWVDPKHTSEILGVFDIFNDWYSMPTMTGFESSSVLQVPLETMDGFETSSSLQEKPAAPNFEQHSTQRTAASVPVYQILPKTAWPPAPQDRDAHQILDKARSYARFREMLFSAPTLSDFLFDNPSNVLSQDVKFLLEPIRRAKETAEFLATYWVVYLLLRWLILQTEESYNTLPPWFRPTKMQREVRHAIGIDLIPWPTLRDELIRLSATNPEKSQSIAIEIGMYLEVDLSGCNTNLNGHDQTLHNGICDLRNWKIQEGFFLLHPQWKSIQEESIAEFYK